MSWSLSTTYRASYEAVRKAATDFLLERHRCLVGRLRVAPWAPALRATLLQGEACGLTAEQPSEDELRSSPHSCVR